MRALIALALAAALAACGDDAAVPTGQVAATVGGEEITLSQVRQEREQLPAGADGRMALESLVTRAILARHAEKEGYDRLPETDIARRRAANAVLADALSRDIRNNVPAISEDEAAQYVAGNPDLFSRRQLHVVDRLAIGSGDRDLLKTLEGLDTLEAMERALRKSETPYARTVSIIDPIDVGPDYAATIVALPPGEIFLVPSARSIDANRIRESIELPLTGEEAQRIARRQLEVTRTGRMLANRVEELREQNAALVRYNPLFAPREEARRLAGAQAR